MHNVIPINEKDYDSILRQAVAVLPWGHVLDLMRKFGNDDNAIALYTEEIIQKGWSRDFKKRYPAV